MIQNLSDMIGYSELTRTKDVLRKTFNYIKNEIKTQNFENQINTQKQTLVDKIGAAISQENNLFERINEVIGPIKTGINISSIKNINEVLLKLQNSSN